MNLNVPVLSSAERQHWCQGSHVDVRHAQTDSTPYSIVPIYLSDFNCIMQWQGRGEYFLLYNTQINCTIRHNSVTTAPIVSWIPERFLRHLALDVSRSISCEVGSPGTGL